MSQIGLEYKIMSLDSNFSPNFNIISLSQSNTDNKFYNHRLVKTSNTIYFCSTLNVVFDENITLYQSYTIPMDESLNPKTCVKNNVNIYNEPYYYEIPIGYGTDTGFDYSVINTPLNIINFRAPLDLKSVDVLQNTTIIDLTECIWPRFDCEFKNCSFPLPEFILERYYSIKIGTNKNITKSFILRPFNHCQDAKYLVTVIDIHSNIQPSWIFIDQQTESITIDTSNITSVQNVQLSFIAKLITFSYNEADSYTTQNFAFNVIMENNNCNLISHSIPNYLILNQISNFTINFEDDEDDIVKIQIQNNQYFSSFVKYISSETVILMIQPEGSLGDQFNVTIYFTDSFHLNEEDWQNFTTQMTLFASIPPTFDKGLNSISVNKCQNYLYLLPTFSDPDSNNITAKLGEGTPNWISMNKNFTISLNSKSGNDVKEGLTQVDIVLIDETNSWTKYTINITVEPLISPIFGLIPNVNIEQLEGDGVVLNITSDYKVDVIGCDSDSLLSWIIFDNSKLKINSYFIIPTQACLRLVSQNSCGSKIYSNLFHLESISTPPALANKVVPFVIPKGIYTLFELPDDLFINNNGEALFYNASITSCSQNHFFDIGIKSEKDRKPILYAYSNYTMYCKGSVTTSNQQHTSEVEIILNVISCSSKNCIKCFGPYQNQCTECDSEYRLEQSGACLRNIDYFSFQNLTFFRVCSIITFISLLIHIILSIFFGRETLNNIINVQLITVFILCVNSQYLSINDYLSNVLFFKFDFGFIHKFTFENNRIGCTFDSNKMADLNFYCQSTLQNYFFMLLIASASMLLWMFFIIVYKSQKLNILLLKIQKILQRKKSNTVTFFMQVHFAYDYRKLKKFC